MRRVKRLGGWAGWCAGALVAGGGAGAAPLRNVFDDDWTPPKRADPVVAPVARAVPAAGSTGAAPVVVPADPARPAGTEPATPAPRAPAAGVTPAPARREVPAKAEQARSRALMREVFAAQLADRTPGGRRKLAQALLAQAAGTADSPADQFVLLTGAYEAGKEAGAVRACFEAADGIAGAFALDAGTLKVDAAVRANYGADPQAAPENVRAGLDLIDALVGADDFAQAARVGAALQGAATAGNGPLRADVAARLRDVAALRLAQDRAAQGLEKLKAAPDDPGANRAVGTYLCLTRDRWDAGLAYLAKSGEPALKAAAAADLAGPTGGPAQVAAGDAWWAVGEREAGPLQQGARARAAKWYAQALASGQVVGLGRAVLEKRIAAAPRAAAATDRRAAAGPVNVIQVGGNKGLTAAFERVAAGGKVRVVGRADVEAMLAAADPYAGAGVVVFLNNAWRETPANHFTPVGKDALQRFVRAGGDLVMFEQFGADNMGVFESIFGVHTGGGSRGVVAADPELRAKTEAVGLTAATLAKEIEVFNKYEKLPEGSRVLLRAGSKEQPAAVIVPYGKGRLILSGTTCDSNVIPLITAMLEVAYPPAKGKP